MYSCEYEEGYKLYLAKVIDLDDPDKKGKIKARPLPELKDIKDAKLPWFKPYKLSNISETKWEHNPPSLNSIIYVLVNKDWTSFRYCGNKIFEDLLKYTESIETPLSNISELSNNDYKDLNWRLYEDGGLEFHNTNNGSHGFIHKSGSCNIYDSNGNIFVKPTSNKSCIIDNGNGKIELKATGIVDINNGNLEILV